MTQDAAGTTGPARITDHELVALVDLRPTPQGRRALEAVGVADLLTDAAAVRAGHATLLVRDLAVVESFNDQPVSGTLSMAGASEPKVVLAIPEGSASVAADGGAVKWTLGPRALVVIQVGEQP